MRLSLCFRVAQDHCCWLYSRLDLDLNLPMVEMMHLRTLQCQREYGSLEDPLQLNSDLFLDLHCMRMMIWLDCRL